MKTRLCFSTFLSLFVGTGLLCAQADTTKTKKPLPYCYRAMYLNLHKLLWWPNSSGLANISFPYSVKDLSTNKIEQKVFKLALDNPYAAASSWQLGLIGFELGGRKQFFNLAMSLNINPAYSQSSVTGISAIYGYGFRFYVRKPHRRDWTSNYGSNYRGLTSSTKNKWILDLGLNFDIHSTTYMLDETISNSNKEVYLPGITAHAQFTRTVKKGSGSNATSTNIISNATDIYLRFSQNGLSVCPQISLSPNPVVNQGYWKFTFSVMIPVYTEASIDVTQHGSGGSRQAGSIWLDKAPVQVMYAGRQVRRYPFGLGGFTFGITWGWRKSKVFPVPAS